MAKGYWFVAYRSVKNPAALTGYAELAVAAIKAAGGRFLARGGVAATHESGLAERTVIVEFDSVEAAKAAYDGALYKKALDALGDAAERDFRIIGGVD